MSSARATSGRDADLRYRMLGPVEVLRGDDVVDLGVLKQRALLALLLINANDVVSTDRIIDELWGDRAGKDREKALWVVVSRLRTALEPDRKKRSEGSILLSRPPGYVLSVDPNSIDANLFSSLATEGRALIETDPAAASLTLSEALGLWRGHALEEFMYEAFAEAEVTRLEELRLTALEDRIDADLRTGRARELVGELEGLVRQHPARERMAAHLMLALHLSGRQGDALRAFGVHRAHLSEELGLDPSPDLSRLEERIVLDDPELRQIATLRALAGRPESGLSIRGYELREQIGSGAMGTVYRAFQPAVGREVAIKVIRSELANDPAFIRQFEAEARVVARLQHPQIVPVFDYWREPDSAYVVTRRFERGSLRDLVESDGVSREGATTVVTQVGAAVAAAHRQGVAHGDVTPENVLIDADGNAYLADFGLSWSAGAAEEFAAPELLPSGDPTPAADVFSLGQLAAYVCRTVTDLDVAGVVARATAARPSDRFPDVHAFLEAFSAAAGAPAETVTADIVNPYRGLHAFDEADADRFFGRERLIERLLARLGHRGPQGRFVAVVGPSGSGKSSVVRAGVVPALRAGAVPGSDTWFIVTMVPGRHPFEALEEALRSIAVDPPPDLLEKLSTDGIASAVEAFNPDPAGQVVLVVDQLEELFSLAEPHVAERFMSALADVATDRHSSVKVMATLRADFYDHPLRHHAFGELVRLGTEVITPMKAQDLERAITGPAEGVGVSFETGLAAAIAADMAGQPTALPLLQYALTELFERRAGTSVTIEAYESLGGVSGALARRADGIYENLPADDQQRVHDIFLRLVTLNEGAGETRRRALVSELSDMVSSDGGPVLEAFGRHRLLSFDRDAATRGPTVEIAHEALLTEWSRLRQWIAAGRADIQAERQLAAAAQECIAAGGDADFLLSGARLGRYEGWLDDPPLALTEEERAFLVKSEAATTAELEMERRRSTRLRRLVAGVGAALVLALLAGGLALQQQRRAEDEAASALDAASDAQLATLVSNSAATRDDEPNLAMLLALEAHARQQSPATEQAVLNAVSSASFGSRVASRPRMADDCTGTSILFSVGGMPAEAATVDGVMTVRNAVTGEILGETAPPGPCTIGGAGPEAGTAQSFDGRTVWLGPDLDVVVELDLPEDSADIQQSIGTGLGTEVLLFEQGTQSARARALIVSQASGEIVGEPIVGSGDFWVFVEWSPEQSPDGSLFAMGFGAVDTDRGELVIAEAATGNVVTRAELPTCCPAIAWDPATGHVALAFQDGLIRTIDPATGEVLTELQLDAQRGPVALGFADDGRLVVVFSNGIVLADREGGRVDTPIPLLNVNEAVVAPGGLVAVATDEASIEVFDPLARALTREIELGRNERIGFSDGLAGVTSLGRDEGAAVIDLTTGERTAVSLTMPDGSTFVDGVVYPAPGGVWAVSPDHVLARWEDGEMVESLHLGSDDDVVSVVYGELKPAGTRWGDLYAVTGRRADGTTEVTVARMEPGEAEVLLTIPSPGAQWAHPTPDGGVYIHGGDGMLRVHSADGELRETWPTGAKDVYAFSLDPTGATLAFGDLGGRRQGLSDEPPQILLVDTQTGVVDTVRQDGIVSIISFNGDGSKMVLAMFDGTVRFLDVEAGGVPTIVWRGTGTFDSEPGWYDEATDSIWTSAGGTLLNIPVDPDGWVELACSIVGRDLTQDEWDRFVPGDEPLRSVCENS